MSNQVRNFIAAAASVVAVVTSLLVMPSAASAAGDRPAITGSKAEVEALSAKLRKTMPGLIIDSIKPAAIPGLWELVSGGDVAYFTPDGVYMI